MPPSMRGCEIVLVKGGVSAIFEFEHLRSPQLWVFDSRLLSPQFRARARASLRQKVKELEHRDGERKVRLEQLMERVDNLYRTPLSDVRIHPEIQKRLPEGIRVRIEYIDGLGEGVLHLEPIENGVVIEPIKKEEERNEAEGVR